MIEKKTQKRFHLFSIKKNLRKEKNKKRQEKDTEETNISNFVPKFIDPIKILRFEDDILYIDEKNNEDIAIVAGYGYFNNIANIQVSHTYNHVSCNLINKDHDFASWRLLYDRLKTLGNQEANTLAELIIEMKNCKINNAPILMPSHPPINPHPKIFQAVEENYLNEINNFLSQKKEAVYFIGKHNLIAENQSMKGLEGLVFSNEFLKLVFGDLEKCVNGLIDHSLSTLDFITVDSAEYYQYLQTSFLSRVGVNKPISFRIKTYEGYSIKLVPKMSFFSLKDINENVYKLTSYAEFQIPEYFQEILAKSRQQKTHVRLKKTEKEKRFENLRNLYFEKLIHENTLENTNISDSGKENEDSKKKICGYRMIDPTNQNK